MRTGGGFQDGTLSTRGIGTLLLRRFLQRFRTARQAYADPTLFGWVKRGALDIDNIMHMLT